MAVQFPGAFAGRSACSGPYAGRDSGDSRYAAGYAARDNDDANDAIDGNTRDPSCDRAERWHHALAGWES